MPISKEPYGHTPDGQAVDIYTLTNANGIEAQITTYGGIVAVLRTPDRTGKTADVVLGFDSLDGYLAGHPYFGALCGRFANRVAKGVFTIDGVEYSLATNDGENHLHGGLKGFDKAVWAAVPAHRNDAVGLALTHVSPDGDEGYPGALSVAVTYWLTDADALRIEYQAETDGATCVNLTNHSYFNLAGAGEGNILAHQLQIDADGYTPVGPDLIPTGETAAVAGTALDFRTARAIGERIEQVAPGYDHNFVLRGQSGDLARAARVYEPTSGRVMEVHTTEPGVQLYTGNFLDGTVAGKRGVAYEQHYAFCLETQHYPDSPNQPGFPSTVLRPGKTYRQVTQYAFSTD